MRRLVFLMVLTAALATASTTAATVQPPMMSFSTTPATGCVAGQANGFSYGGITTYTGQSGFVAGAPASPITRTTIIEPMVLDRTTTNDHSLGYWSVGSQTSDGFKSWLQIGVEIGAAPANGWNTLNGPGQYLSVPTMYVEYASNLKRNTDGTWSYSSYYFSTVGASSGYGHYDYFSLRQETNGSFTALINSVPVFSNAGVPVNGGRSTGGVSEDYSYDAACDNQDIYFEMQTDPGYMSFFYFMGAPLDVCAGRGNAQYYMNWESWNSNYGARRHGIPYGILVCAY